MLGLFINIYKTKLASNEIFQPSKKISREVSRAKDLLAPLYMKKEAEPIAESWYYIGSQRMGKVQRKKVTASRSNLTFLRHKIQKHFVSIGFY